MARRLEGSYSKLDQTLAAVPAFWSSRRMPPWMRAICAGWPREAMFGLARTGSSGANGSGDYGIAFSTARNPQKVLSNDEMSPLFLAVIEASEKAIYNSLLRAVDTTGNGHRVEALPIDKTLTILRRYNVTP